MNKNNVMKNQKEVWLPVKGYEGCYEVSNLGRVKSLIRKVNSRYGLHRTVKERILRPNYATNYLTVELNKNNIGKNRTIHQLVAESFLDHVPQGYKLVVDHIDNNKHNNNVENLQIITHRENLTKDRGICASKYAGVYFNKYKNRWVARISINKKTIYLGSFINEKDAGEAYIKKQNKLQR